MLTDSPTATLILVVEDDDNHAELIRRSFKDSQEEYCLDFVRFVSDAHKAIKLRIPHLVLTDYRLPDGNGNDLVLAAKGLCPVAMMTSQGNEQVAVEVMKAGAQDYIVKSPDAFSSIPRIVKQVLREWNLVLDLRKTEEERLLLEQQIQQARKLESLGVLTGGIAHDFNNILTVILGHCYMLMSKIGASEPDNAMHVQQIETAANRAAGLCRQMLTYAGKSPLLKARVNMRLLVDEMVKMLTSAIRENVSFELDVKSDVPDIIGDASQIQQVIMNLIINAAEAIGDANGTVKVILAQESLSAGQKEKDFFGNMIRAGRYACLEVSDTGCGMDDETRQRIFEPFYTTKFTGRGLGMSAILGIIKSHEGALQLSSKPFAGTTFKVYFPISAIPEIAEHSLTENPVLQGIGSGTILIVDDEEILRDAGSALLSIMGFSVLTAANGQEALSVHQEHGSGINLVLLDLFMPKMGGLETYHELRKRAPTLPIVICSGYNVEKVIDEIVTDEKAGVVQKPYRPEQLWQSITKVMAGGK